MDVFFLNVGSASEVVLCYKVDVMRNQSQQVSGVFRPGIYIAAYKQFVCSAYVHWTAMFTIIKTSPLHGTFVCS